MKKFICMLAAAVLAVGVAGCSSGSNTENTENTESTESTQADGEKNEIIVFAAASMTETMNEIAEMYNVSPKTIDYRIQKSLKILRQKLSDYLPAALLAVVMEILENPWGGV